MSSYQTNTMDYGHCDSYVHEHSPTANTLQETHSSCKLLQIGGKGHEGTHYETHIIDTTRGRGNLWLARGEDTILPVRGEDTVLPVRAEVTNSVRNREGRLQSVGYRELQNWEEVGEVRSSTLQVVLQSAAGSGGAHKVGAEGARQELRDLADRGTKRDWRILVEVLRLPAVLLQSSTGEE